MQIVWITRLLPDRAGGPEAARELDLLRQAAVNHDVHLISPMLPPGEVDFPLGDRSITAEGVRNPRARYPRTPLGFLLLPTLARQTVDLRVHAGRTQALSDALAGRLARRTADLVHISGGELAPLVTQGRRSGVPVALLVDRAQFRHCHERKTTSPDRLRAVRWALDTQNARRWEHKWYHEVQALACTSPEEQIALTGLLGFQPTVVSPGDGVGLLSWWEATSAKTPLHRRARSIGTPAPAINARWPRTNPTATVVVCTRNRPELLEQSLRTVAESIHHEPGTEVLIIEQGRRTARKVCDDLKLRADVVHDDGVGAARARNIGCRRACSDVVLFTDDDCAVPATWVSDHLEVLRQPDVTASFGAVTGISRFTDEPTDGVAWRARHHKGSPPWVVGHSANMAMRRDAFLAIGGFDERFGPGAPHSVICEDADLIVRLLHADGVAVSGTGQPVRHLEWRSRDEDYRNLRAYERGAGAWIGKLYRHDARSARPYLRQRVQLLADRMREFPGIREAPLPVLLSLGAFVRGLAFGLRLPWWESTKDGAPRQDSKGHARTVRVGSAPDTAGYVNRLKRG